MDPSTFLVREINGRDNFSKLITIVEYVITTIVTDMAKEDIDNPDLISLDICNVVNLIDQLTPKYWFWDLSICQYSGSSSDYLICYINENIDMLLEETDLIGLTDRRVIDFMESTHIYGAKSKTLIGKTLKERQV